MILLMDNGSLEAASTLGLRVMAAELGRKLGERVTPVSLLHSSAVAVEKLAGEAAEILEPALEKRLRAGITEFLIVPAFFGPSLALVDYLPRRIAALKARFPELTVRVAQPLVDVADRGDTRIASLLGERVRHAAAGMVGITAAPLPCNELPAVVVVDHGSPVREVTAVREHVAAQLHAQLASSFRSVVAASMERRPGPEYAFNEPLLASVFDRAGFDSGIVIVALLFLSPGRHAGPGGDIAQICAAATVRHPALMPVLTAPIGDHPLVVELLAERAKSAFAATPL